MGKKKQRAMPADRALERHFFITALGCVQVIRLLGKFVWQYSANMRQRGERPIPFPFPPNWIRVLTAMSARPVSG